jgi:pimeloyl-ACP methyl ester carboxylesterase
MTSDSAQLQPLLVPRATKHLNKTMVTSDTPFGSGSAYTDAATQAIEVDGTVFAYRDLGPRTGVPLVLLNHWGAALDDFDPRIVDGLARRHRVIATNYRGIGASGGTAPVTIEAMARDVTALVRALGFEKVDLLGFSLGGFVAQDIVQQAPDLVRRLILTGTAPAGGQSIDKVGAVSWPLMLKGVFTGRDPKTYLFFTSTANGRQAAQAFLARLKERRSNRDKGPTPRAFWRQLQAIKAWGRQTPQELGRVQIPVLIAAGDNDILVPTANSHDMVRRLPHAELVVYEDAGHGAIFQYRGAFVTKALSFLGD